MDIKEILRNNMERLRALDYFTSNRSLSEAVGVSSATINTLTVPSDTTHPKINKLDDVARTLKVPAWALLVENFPFEQYGKRRFKTLSPEVIELAQILDNLQDKDISALMEYARFMSKRT